MSAFQKILGRFLGQFEGSYNPNVSGMEESIDSSRSTLQRSRSLSKIINPRRQRSFEIFKSASCLSCGVNEYDRQVSINRVNKLVPISSRYENKQERNSLVNRSNENNYTSTTLPSQQQIRQKRRAKTKLIIIRHGERVDALFGDEWLSKAFDQNGIYRRFHANLPISPPYRQNFQDFKYDPPLTELGIIRSFRTGEALYRTGLRIDYCYSSPSLRCVQTADSILDGMKLRTLVPIRIELGLFECGLWHRGIIPHFMSINELVLNRLNIETSYNSIQKSLSTDETEYDYYERSHSIMRQILSRHDAHDVTILFIGHAPSLETLTRQLIGAQPRPAELAQIAQKINYLSLTILEGQKRSWTFVDAILGKQF